MNKSAIYWGTFLVCIGLLLLIKSLGAMTEEFTIFIRLWPLFLIFWGLSIIKFPEILRKILVVLSAVFLALFIFAVFNSGWSFTRHHIFFSSDNDNNEINIQQKERLILEYDSTIKKGTLNLDFGTGEFLLRDTTQKSLEADGSNFNIKDDKNKNSDSQVNINIDAPKSGHFDKKIKGAFNLNLKLNPRIEWHVDADFGAADVNMDLQNFIVPTVRINTGASALNLTLGKLATYQLVSIDCGAADIIIRIPKESGCRLETNTFLSGKDFEGFNGTEHGFVSGNYETSQNKIEIKLNGAISNFSIVKY